MYKYAETIGQSALWFFCGLKLVINGGLYYHDPAGKPAGFFYAKKGGST